MLLHPVPSANDGGEEADGSLLYLWALEISFPHPDDKEPKRSTCGPKPAAFPPRHAKRA